jgi:hypothetical protein
VSQGQCIGFVGATGLATGPHLHYEFRVNGVATDPRLSPVEAGTPVADDARLAFEQTVERLNAFLQAAPVELAHGQNPPGGMSGGETGPMTAARLPR